MGAAGGDGDSVPTPVRTGTTTRRRTRPPTDRGCADGQTAGMDVDAPAFAPGTGQGLPLDAGRRRRRPRDPPGERVALLGPNGAGKTTTLLMCLGTITPDEGIGRDLRPPPAQGPQRPWSGVGFAAGLPAPPRPPAGAGGAHHLRRALRRRRPATRSCRGPRPLRHGPPGRPDVRRAVLGPAHDRRASSRPSSTSRSCWCSTSPRPRSTPTWPSGCAPRSSGSNAEDGTTLLVTSHDMNEVERLCERVVFLQPAGCVHDGTPAEILSEHGHASLEDVFLHLAAGQQRAVGRRVVNGAPGPGRRPPPLLRPHAQPPPLVRRRSSGPLVDVLLWGSLGVFVANQSPDADRAGVTYLLAGILLFHVLYQSQIAASTGFLEETWSRNLLNLMATPLTEVEYAAGVALFGLAKLAVAMGVVSAGRLRLLRLRHHRDRLGPGPHRRCCCWPGWAISLFVDRARAALRPERRGPGLGDPLRGDAAVGRLLPGRGPAGVAAAHRPGAAHDPRLRRRPRPARRRARCPGTSSPRPRRDLVVAVAGIAFVAAMLRTFRQRGYVTRFS